jgi:hypothetical protein
MKRKDNVMSSIEINEGEPRKLIWNIYRLV